MGLSIAFSPPALIFALASIASLACGASPQDPAAGRAVRDDRADREQADEERVDDGPRSPRDKAAKPAAMHTCNVCGSTGEFNAIVKRPGAECPVCKTKERHRLLVHYFEHGTGMFKQKLDVLHFSPQEAEETVYRHQPNWHYVTTDYEHTEDLGLDLTAMDQPDDAWDVIIVYHILEHILEDVKAMKELYRVIRPGGKVILQVPLETKLVDNYEDPTITDPKERIKHFGQSNHVRKYSVKGWRQRLESVGFQVEAVDYIARLDPAIVAKHRMSGAFDPPLDESIWVCTKPAPAGTPPAPGG